MEDAAIRSLVNAVFVTAMLVLVPFLLVGQAPFVDGQATPTLTIDTPTESEIVMGEIQVKGTSTDAAQVEIKIDAEDNWHLADGTDQWIYAWDTTTVSNDAHTIFARARNGTATSDTAQVRVHVDNSPPEYIDVNDITATPTDLGPRENITVSGFIEYDNGVRIKNATVDMFIMGEDISASAITDDNGYFIEVLLSPVDAGTYTLRLLTTDGTLNASRDFTLTVTTPYQPDLAVDKIEISPPEPKTEETVTIYATIKNHGDQEGTGKVKFYIDDNLKDSKKVNVDKTRMVQTTWHSKRGEHTIKVEVVDVDPADGDLSNNVKTMKVHPKAEPIVEIVDILLSNPVPREEQRVTVQVKLENKGDAGTTGTVRLYQGDPDAGGTLIADDSFTINANQTMGVFMVWSPEEGEQTLHARITVQGQEETDEHSKSKAVSVLPPVKKKKEDTPGLGIGTVVLAVTVVAMAMAIIRKRREWS
jgi:hypothetical protein